MANSRRIIHILDDLAMGGVTRALKNFEHPELAEHGAHDVVDIRQSRVRATSSEDVAVIHFTANWKKMAWLAGLRIFGGFSRIILIEHTYTEGFEVNEVQPKRRFRWMLKCAYSLVDTVVAVSKTQRDWIVLRQLAAPEKVIAIPQSRTCDDLLKLAPLERSKGPLQIRAYGRFHKQKGFDLLIEAMTRVPARLASLKIAGEGSDGALLRSLSQGLSNVEICGPFVSPDAFLADADVVAISSRWEAFGLVGTEARAAGRPLIAARVDGLNDQLDEGSFSHAPGQVASLVRAIYAAAAATDLKQRGTRARTKAAGEFDQMIVRWRALLIAPSNVDAR